MKRFVLLFCELILFICLFTVCDVSFAQIPVIQWQSSFGGSDRDYSNYIQQTKDSGYIAIGRTYSSDGQITGFHAPATNEDIWVIKLTATGALAWEKCLGGSGTDQGKCIQQTKDGGYILTGWTNSTDGDITQSFGGGDVWVVKLNDTGNIVWQRSYGEMGDDEGYYIQQTSDSGFIVAGRTDYEPGYHFGTGTDMWVIKLDDTGGLTWKKCYGGTNDDEAYAIHQTNDGGYIVGGITASSDGDVTYNHGGMYDYWVVKIDDTGKIVWQHTYGGSGDDEGKDISLTIDSGYIMTGFSSSTDGDKTSVFGGYDIWTIKINDTGGIIWNKSYGGSSDDYAASVQQTADSGYVIAGYSYSSDGEVSANYGDLDMWVVKTDSMGNLQWQKNLGGDSIDECSRAIQTFDGGFAVIGWTRSVDHDVTSNHGAADIWVAKLRDSAVTALVPITIKQDLFYVYPNPANSVLNITAQNLITQITITNLIGQTIFTQSYNAVQVQVDVAHFPPGVYFVKINGSEVRRFVKE